MGTQRKVKQTERGICLFFSGNNCIINIVVPVDYDNNQQSTLETSQRPYKGIYSILLTTDLYLIEVCIDRLL